MAVNSSIAGYLSASATAHGDRTAVEEPGEGAISYRELDELSDRLRDRLCDLGVRPGDRVGLCLRKSIDAVVALFGALKAGAAYVPVDLNAPIERNAYILADCSVRVVVLEARFADGLRMAFQAAGEVPQLIVLPQAGGAHGVRQALELAQDSAPAPVAVTTARTPDDLAYILYTSGSTGRPKGVMLSHRNGSSFVDWCSEVFEPRPDDRFSSHAPFHFDLSILDIFLSIKHAATLVLISDDVAKDPLRLALFIAERRLTIWYSAPSILSLLAQYGNVRRYDYSPLRLVLFAGEVFPVRHLRTFKSLVPSPRYFNLYGPTETNVCTYFQIPDVIPAEETRPYPIGAVCSHLCARVVDEHGHDVTPGQEGELCIGGAAVMQGYWNLPERTAAAFLNGAEDKSWYRTGDIVVEEDQGTFRFLGRRDRMVKRRGFRVELGEIEAALYRHPAVKEAAAVALQDEEQGVRIKAFLNVGGEGRPSLIELKAFCAQHLPMYMIPDWFVFRDALPKTSTDKVDYQRLKDPERWTSA